MGFCCNNHRHCKHTPEMHEDMGWTCDLWQEGGVCCEPDPTVGMGATLQIGSDSYPYTIVKISRSGHCITASRDHYRRTDGNGQSELQTYEYTSDPNGVTDTFYRCKDGRYRQNARHLLYIGARRAYRDPSF